MLRSFAFGFALVSVCAVAHADVTPVKKPQGVAVVAIGLTRDDAAALARAVYGSTLRPRALDEPRARALVGDRPAPYASKEVKELGELRTSLTGDDPTTRRLLSSLGQQLDLEAFLAVTDDKAPIDADAGAPPLESTTKPVARLFIVASGEFDAARYEPDPDGWRSTVSSLVQQKRFTTYSPLAASSPAPTPPPPAKITAQKGGESTPFYKSPWLWGALGAALLIGGFFLFASQETESDPITVKMRVPR